MNTECRATSRVLALSALIVAGEAIFLLPFVFPRVFRPTILDVFGLTNSELGQAFALYGVVGMFAYLAGGPLADIVGPRRLLVAALVVTALGGAVLWTIPPLATLKSLYAFWGFSTIALFWSALIRATREWGGTLSQGSAFGLLDGGRGLFAAMMASGVVALYGSLLPADVESATLEVRTRALQQVIVVLSSVTLLAAVMIWTLLPRRSTRQQTSSAPFSFQGVMRVARMPVVWLQALMIVCAYVGYKAVDDFSLYAKEVLLINEVEAARVGTYSLWVRPVAAIGAGFLADRCGAGRMTVVSFLLMILGSVVLGMDTIKPHLYGFYVITIGCASLGVYALRGLYFAIMEEGQVPLAYTGTAVGLVSMIGYTPDVFMGPLMGELLDGAPGAIGHRHVFLVVTGFGVVGLMASLVFMKMAKRKRLA